MAKNQNNRGGNRHSSNNPEGRNQYNSGFIGMARERPAAAAAIAAGTAAAGVFLWSKRGQISDQLSQLSEQIGVWTENMSSERELELAGTEFSGSSRRGASGEFDATAGSTGSASRGATPRSTRPTSNKRRSATSGSGTMSGGSLDTGPSGRGRE